VHALRLLQLRHLPAFQHLQYFRQHDAARGRRRRGDDVPVAVTDADRIALLHHVAGQVRGRPRAAVLVDVGDDAPCQLAAVETLAAILRDRFKRVGEFRLQQLFARLGRIAIGQEQLARSRRSAPSPRAGPA
jgi:hypothetical protein